MINQKTFYFHINHKKIKKMNCKNNQCVLKIDQNSTLSFCNDCQTALKKNLHIDCFNKELCCVCGQKETKENCLIRIERSSQYYNTFNKIYTHENCIMRLRNEKQKKYLPDLKYFQDEFVESKNNMNEKTIIIKELNIHEKVQIVDKIIHQFNFKNQTNKILFDQNKNLRHISSFLGSTKTIIECPTFGVLMEGIVLCYVSCSNIQFNQEGNMYGCIQVLETFDPYKKRGYARMLVDHVEKHFFSKCNYVWLFPADEATDFWMQVGYYYCGEVAPSHLESYHFIKYLNKRKRQEENELENNKKIKV